MASIGSSSELSRAVTKAAPDFGGTTCKTALSLFDTNKDGTITAAEVAGNSVLKTLLAPDVKLLDADGHYAPDPANAVKDSFSVGIGFSAERATITH